MPVRPSSLYCMTNPPWLRWVERVSVCVKRDSLTYTVEQEIGLARGCHFFGGLAVWKEIGSEVELPRDWPLPDSVSPEAESADAFDEGPSSFGACAFKTASRLSSENRAWTNHPTIVSAFDASCGAGFAPADSAPGAAYAREVQFARVFSLRRGRRQQQAGGLRCETRIAPDVAERRSCIVCAQFRICLIPS